MNNTIAPPMIKPPTRLANRVPSGMPGNRPSSQRSTQPALPQTMTENRESYIARLHGEFKEPYRKDRQ